MNEGTGVTIEVDTLLRIEEHILARIDLEDEVLQGTHANNAGNLVALCLTHIVELTQLHRGLVSILYHQCHQVVGINNRSLTTLHLTVWQFYHTI